MNQNLHSKILQSPTMPLILPIRMREVVMQVKTNPKVIVIHRKMNGKLKSSENGRKNKSHHTHLNYDIWPLRCLFVDQKKVPESIRGLMMIPVTMRTVQVATK